MELKCRRCPKLIGEDEVAHLVAVRTSGYQLTSELNQTIVVCDDCLGVHEKGFQETGYVYVPKPKPEPELTQKQSELLFRVAQGHVYRLPRRIMLLNEDTGTSTRCTDNAYHLLKAGFARWEIVPEKDRLPGAPNAWMRLTDDGVEWLRLKIPVTT